MQHYAISRMHIIIDMPINFQIDTSIAINKSLSFIAKQFLTYCSHILLFNPVHFGVGDVCSLLKLSHSIFEIFYKI